MTHIWVSKIIIIVSDNGLSPGRRRSIIWTNAGILLTGPLGTNFSENFNRNSNFLIQENAPENIVCAIASILFRPQCVNHKIQSKARTTLIFLMLYSILWHEPQKGRNLWFHGWSVWRTIIMNNSAKRCMLNSFIGFYTWTSAISWQTI